MEHANIKPDAPPRLLDARSAGFLERLIVQVPLRKYLNRLKQHHHESYDHSIRVALLCIDLGYENRLSGSDIRTVGYAGLLHDLGKTEIDAALLSKPSSLTQEERQAVRMHPRRGYVQIEDEVFRKVKRVIAGHHEFQKAAFPRSGGERRGAEREEGAERRTADAQIDRLTQIVAVSDMFDALVSRRSYKAPLPGDQVRAIMEDQFTGDPALIDQVMTRF